MKIVLANAWLEYFLGSERWTFTMAEELKKRGHDVYIATFLEGPMLQMFKNIGIKQVGIMDIDTSFDLAIVNHNVTLPQIPKEVFSICTSHGPYSELEQPIKGASEYVSVSEEVQLSLSSKGFASALVRNPVNLDAYKPIRPTSPELRKVLFITNHFSMIDPTNKMVAEACEEMRIDFMPVGLGFGNAQWELEETINLYDCVVSIGRGIVESMACGRNVIVGGMWGLGGMITNRADYDALKKYNFSGRVASVPMSKEALMNEFRKYNPAHGNLNRLLATKYHDVRKVVDEYLRMYEKNK